ncbi:hypothetical protein BV25DRAFT_1819486 [Artomyces pyxidatus]|uniref:Uncharacterized protein n=1 Tax=Artomyces pyxidatus TaxID=48021 RepID=A0ACB8TFG6_9AGAM|nr:hypothetical protein BV25DRAFT_1819486 [Artomyces pyxidatus]
MNEMTAYSTDGEHPDSGFAEVGSCDEYEGPYSDMDSEVNDFLMSQDRYFRDDGTSYDCVCASPAKSLDIVEFPSSPLPASSYRSPTSSVPSDLRTALHQVSVHHPDVLSNSDLESRTIVSAVVAPQDVPLVPDTWPTGRYIPFGRLLALRDTWNSIGKIMNLPPMPTIPDTPSLDLFVSAQMKARNGVGWTSDDAFADSSSPHWTSLRANTSSDSKDWHAIVVDNDERSHNEAHTHRSTNDEAVTMHDASVRTYSPINLPLFLSDSSDGRHSASDAASPQQCFRSIELPFSRTTSTSSPQPMSSPHAVSSSRTTYLSTAEVDLDALLPPIPCDSPRSS